MSQEIPRYTIIYYVGGMRVLVHFSASSEPKFEVTNVTCKAYFLTDHAMGDDILNKIKNISAPNLMKFISKISKKIGYEPMAFNYNA